MLLPKPLASTFIDCYRNFTGIDKSVGFGDTMHDGFLFQVTTPVALNPDKKLEELFKSNGWLHFKQEDNVELFLQKLKEKTHNMLKESDYPPAFFDIDGTLIDGVLLLDFTKTLADLLPTDKMSDAEIEQSEQFQRLAISAEWTIGRLQCSVQQQTDKLLERLKENGVPLDSNSIELIKEGMQRLEDKVGPCLPMSSHSSLSGIVREYVEKQIARAELSWKNYCDEKTQESYQLAAHNIISTYVELADLFSDLERARYAKIFVSDKIKLFPYSEELFSMIKSRYFTIAVSAEPVELLNALNEKFAFDSIMGLSLDQYKLLLKLDAAKKDNDVFNRLHKSLEKKGGAVDYLIELAKDKETAIKDTSPQETNQTDLIINWLTQSALALDRKFEILTEMYIQTVKTTISNQYLAAFSKYQIELLKRIKH